MVRKLGLGATVAAVALSVVISGSIVAPAQAYEAGGQGYIDSYQIKDFHAQGIDGSGVTVAVVDTAINLDVPELQGADIRVKEPSQCYGPGGVEQSAISDDPALALHGTNMVALIVGNGTGYDGQTGITGIAPKATVLFYSVRTQSGCESASGIGTDHPGLVWEEMVSTAIIDATDQGADIISFSIDAASVNVEAALAYAYRHDVIVVASLKNQDSENVLDHIDNYPATNNGVISVGAFDREGNVLINGSGKLSTSDYVDVVAPGGDILVRGSDTDWKTQTIGQGNSAATAITAGNLALAIQKYPTATHNQIIQSLLHNTGTEPHELLYDSKGQYGYGTVDTISLLAADPSQFEDVNPLLLEDIFPGPTWAEVFGDPSAAPSPSATVDPTTQPTATAVPGAVDEGSSPVMWLLIGGGLLLITLIGVGIVIVISRSKSQSTDNGRQG